MRYRGLFGGLAILAGASAASCRGPDLIQPVRDARIVEYPAVVTLVGWVSPTKGAGGTGFLVARDRVVTCRHVLMGVESVFYRLGDGRQAPVRGILAEAPEHDLLLLSIDPVEGIEPLTLAEAMPQAGTALTAVGSPDLRAQTVTPVVVLPGGETATRRFGPVIEVRGELAVGSSGCPLLDERGRVVGVAAKGDLTTNVFGAVPVRFVRALAPVRLESMADWGRRTAADPVVQAENGYDAAGHAYRRKDYAEALKKCEDLLPRVVKLPGYPELVCDLLAASLGALHRTDEAVDRLRKLVALHPQEAWSHRSLGTLLGKLGRYSEAVVAFEEASRLDPGDVGARLAAATALARLRRYSEAAVQARAVLAIAPGHAEAEFLLGSALLMEGKPSEGLLHLEAAHRKMPDDIRVNTNLGWALAGSGRVQEGVALLGKAVQLAPGDAIARQDLARALLYAGDRAGAYRENEVLRGLDSAKAAEIDLLLAHAQPDAAR